MNGKWSQSPSKKQIGTGPATGFKTGLRWLRAPTAGIGRAVAILFAREGADISIVYYDEHQDAKETKRMVEREERRCILASGDVADERFCQQAVQETVDRLGRLDILVNNAGIHFPK